MTDSRRLNVALTRREDTLTILRNVSTIDNVKSERQRNARTITLIGFFVCGTFASSTYKSTVSRFHVRVLLSI